MQEESVDKISETSNQPDKTGKTVLYMHRITQMNLFLYAACNASLILSSFRIDGCRNNRDRLHLPPGETAIRA